MKKLQELEELFYDTTKKINSRTGGYNAEQKELLERKISEITRNLIGNLQHYKMSNRVLGNIENKFNELKTMLSKMNQGESEKMAEGAANEIRANVSQIQEVTAEERIEQEEKEEIVNGKFHRIQKNTQDRREQNKQDKDHMYIEDCVKTTYSDIQRNIASYIQTSGVVALGLNAKNIEEIKNIIATSCRSCVQDMSNRHDIHIDEVSRMIEEQVGELQQNVKTVICKEEVEKNPEENRTARNPFQLSDEDLAKFNEGAEKVVKDSQEPKKQPPKDMSLSLPHDVIR